MNFVRNFDAFPKTLPDFAKKTKAGGVLSILTYLLAVYLFSAELIDTVTPVTHYEVGVDSLTPDNQDMTILINMVIATECKRT